MRLMPMNGSMVSRPPIRTLSSLWARGVMVVALISYNTRLIADGRSAAIGIAFLIAVVWWLNAKSASQATGVWGMMAYAGGSSCGTAIGLWAGGL